MTFTSRVHGVILVFTGNGQIEAWLAIAQKVSHQTGTLLRLAFSQAHFLLNNSSKIEDIATRYHGNTARHLTDHQIWYVNPHLV